MGILPYDEIAKVQEAVTAAKLWSSRKALLLGCDAGIVAAIHVAENPRDQIVHDLEHLNAVGVLTDRSVPLVIWLCNAVRSSGMLKEQAAFRSALALALVEAAHQGGEPPAGAAGLIAPAPDASFRAADGLPAGLQIFISYRRIGEEARLAQWIRNKLVQQGIAVFMDVDMTIGTRWVAAIRENIEKSAFFLVLLSKDGMSSEMVQTEVRIAHQKAKRDGAPRLLPIRVAYAGPLEYELARYLDDLQYVAWNTASDDPRVLASILYAIAPSPSRPPPPPSPPSPSSTREVGVDSHPSPSADPRFGGAPGGAMGTRDLLYVERGADREIAKSGRLVGETMLIKGARQRGKSSLLSHYLSACKAAGKRCVRVDFQEFSSDVFETYPQFLTALATAIRNELNIKEEVPEPMTQMKMNTFMQQTVLKAVGGPLTLAFDEADRVFGRAYKSNFFGMLRAWHNKRADSEVWADVDIMLVVSTEPYLFITDTTQSPFNVVASPIDLDSFTLDECRKLNSKYPVQLSNADVDDIYDLLSGHPYLTRLAHYRIVFGGFSVEELCGKNAVDLKGPFGEHLRAMLTLLDDDASLLPALIRAIVTGKLGDDRGTLAHRLIGAGLIRLEGKRYNPANLLYSRFFKSVQ